MLINNSAIKPANLNVRSSDANKFPFRGTKQTTTKYLSRNTAVNAHPTCSHNTLLLPGRR